MLNCLLIISRIAGVLRSGGSAGTNWLGFWWAKCETASKASRANFRCRWIWNCSNFTAASERSLARAFQSRYAESDSCQNQHIRSLRGSFTDHLGLGLTHPQLPRVLCQVLPVPYHQGAHPLEERQPSPHRQTEPGEPTPHVDVEQLTTTLKFFIRCWGHDVR